jgi:hypothetical protein
MTNWTPAWRLDEADVEDAQIDEGVGGHEEVGQQARNLGSMLLFKKIFSPKTMEKNGRFDSNCSYLFRQEN